MTENKCCASMACGWCVAQTLLLTRVAKLPPPGVLALCQLSAPQPLSRKCLMDTLKTVRTRPSRSTSAVATPPSSSPNGSPNSRAQARHSIFVRTTNTCGLKAITSQIEKQPAHHARSTTNCDIVTTNCFENCATLREFAQRHHVGWISWHNKEFVRKWSPPNNCWRFVPAASRRHDPRRFQISAAFCSTMKHPVCIRLAPRLQQVILKLVRLASKLNVTLFHLDT